MQRDPFKALLPQLRTHPYPVFHTMRKLDPVHYSPGWDAWFLTRYEDVERVLREPCFSVEKVSDFSQRLGEPYDMTRIERALAGWLLFTDPPAHGRLRSLISKAFTPRTLKRFEDSVRARISLLLDRMDPSHPVDLMASLASPLPVMTIADVLGGRPEDIHRFENWSHRLATFLGADDLTVAMAEQADLSLQALEDYFLNLLEERRASPGDDLVSSLLAARSEQGEQLSQGEIVSMSILLFAAGHDTTTNLIGNGLLAVLTHPLERRKLVEKRVAPELAVEEILRFDSPSQIASRSVLSEVDLGGKRLLPGQLVNLCLGAANRDPAVFPQPDRFDLERPNLTRHLAFGKGIHTCVGAHLARLEARLVLESILERWPGIRLEGQPERYPTLGFRRLKNLPVRLS